MSFDSHTNFAWSLVSVPPSPPISGTSLTVVTGQGALFSGAAPFNCLVCPANTTPTAANAEIVRVTNISGDTFTVTRAQEGSTAIAVGLGYVFSNNITAKTVVDIENSRGTSSTFGLVQVDGTTITSSAGIISAVGGGSGNVTGPASSTTNNFALYADTTGKLVKDGGVNSASFDAAGSAATAQANAEAASYPGLGTIPNAALTNSAITIAGSSTALGASVTQDVITGLSSTGIIKRTGANALAIATAGTDYLASNQTITLSSDVTGSGTTAITTTIANNAVTNAKAAQMATLTIKGNNTTGTANSIDLTVSQVKGFVTYSATDVGLGNVTNNAQTQSAIVPNTAPAAAQVLVGNAGGTAYAPVSLSGKVTITSAGVASVSLASGDIPNNAANTSGTASNLSGTPALPNGTTATTQSAGDTTTKIATDAFVSTAQLLTYNAQTGTTYTLALTDANLGVSMNNASANTLTVPPNSSVAFVIGSQIVVLQLGAGATTIAAGAGVTINSPGGLLQLAGQYAQIVLEKTATNTWQLAGNISQTAASVSTVAAGTAYTMTGSLANVAFGTTSPSVTLVATGTYLIGYSAQSSLVGATYAAIQQVNFLMNRQNNTPATIAGTSFSSNLPVVTTVTDSGPSVSCAGILYTTANTTDIIGLQADVSATPAAGSVTCSAATITAVWLHA